MSEFETIVFTAITQRKVLDIAAFIANYVNTYADPAIDPAVQFYRLPLIIRLMDIARATLAPNTR